MNTTKDKVHPTTKSPTTTTIKPTPNGPTTTNVPTTTNGPTTKSTTTATNINPKFPPIRPQQPGAAPRYRLAPPPQHRNNNHLRHHRQICTCRRCCLWLTCATLIIIALLVLAAIPAAVFYAVYRPRPPSFYLSSLKITQLNLTAAHFTSKINLKIAATNPNNQKFRFYYNPIDIKVLAHQGTITIGQVSFPSFVHLGKNTTNLLVSINENNSPNDESLEILKSDLKNNKGLDLKVMMGTQMRVKFGEKMKSITAGLIASCDGIKAAASKGNLTGIVKTNGINGVECNVHLIIKIFEWEVKI